MVLFFSSCLETLEIGLTDLNFTIIDIESHNLARQHSEFMISSIKNLIKKNHLKISDIKKIYFTNGPGGFTGNRLGVIFVKTLLILNPKLEVYTIDTLSSLIQFESGIISISPHIGKFFTAKFKDGKLIDNIIVTSQDKSTITANNNTINNMIKKHNQFKRTKNIFEIKTTYIKEL